MERRSQRAALRQPAQLRWQAIAALAGPAYAFAATFVLLRVIGLLMPLRASEREEALGMDVVQHGEEAYATGEGAILVFPDAAHEAAAGARRPTAAHDAPAGARRPCRPRSA